MKEKRRYKQDPEKSRWDQRDFTPAEKAYLRNANKLAGPRASDDIGIFADSTRFYAGTLKHSR